MGRKRQAVKFCAVSRMIFRLISILLDAPPIRPRKQNGRQEEGNIILTHIAGKFQLNFHLVLRPPPSFRPQKQHGRQAVGDEVFFCINWALPPTFHSLRRRPPLPPSLTNKLEGEQESTESCAVSRKFPCPSSILFDAPRPPYARANKMGGAREATKCGFI